MLGRVTKYNVNNDAPSEVFEAASQQERKVGEEVFSAVAGLGRLIDLTLLYSSLRHVTYLLYKFIFCLRLSAEEVGGDGWGKIHPGYS